MAKFFLPIISQNHLRRELLKSYHLKPLDRKIKSLKVVCIFDLKMQPWMWDFHVVFLFSGIWMLMSIMTVLRTSQPPPRNATATARASGLLDYGDRGDGKQSYRTYFNGKGSRSQLLMIWPSTILLIRDHPCYTRAMHWLLSVCHLLFVEINYSYLLTAINECVKFVLFSLRHLNTGLSCTA